MSDTKRPQAPDEARPQSWADETLPLGLRKQLLGRELKQSIAQTSRAGATGSEPDLTRRKTAKRSGERGR